MTGSIKWMVYEANNADNYAILLDESVGNACGFDDFTSASVIDGVLPLYFNMRYVNLVRKAGGVTQRRQAPIGDPTQWDGYADGGTISIDGVIWSVSSTRGEERRVPIAIDTELDDGTPEDGAAPPPV